MSKAMDISNIWIKNIKNLDEKYHLEHGAIYARDGSVSDLEINHNTVGAKVRGAPGKSFNVEIIFKEISNADKKRLTDYIQGNCLLYSKILNNQIPVEIFNREVNFFITSLKDFKMSCECEKGLFCKHKAAVFHKLAFEIDKNPNLVFQFRGFDLTNFTHNNAGIKKIRDILKRNKTPVLDNREDINHLKRMNFMLADYPSFYNSNTVNFNEILYETLSAMSKTIYQIINQDDENTFHEYIILGNTLRSFEYYSSKSPKEIKKAFENKWENPQLWDDFKIDIDGNYEIFSIDVGSVETNLISSDLKYLLFAFFAELNQVDTTFYSDNIRFLQDVFEFTADLIYARQLIPEFFRLDNKHYHIRWVPAFDENIYEELRELSEECPDDLLTFYNTNLSKENQIINIVSLFFEGFAKYFVNKFMPVDLNSFKNETFFRLFFLKSQDLNTYFADSKEYAIDNWLSVLYLKQEDYHLILDISQYNYHFLLELKIEIDGEIYEFEDIVLKKREDIIKNIAIIQNIFVKLDFDYNLGSPRGLDLREYSSFYDDVAPVLEEVGVSVNAPEEFGEVKKAKLVLNASLSPSKGSLTLDDLANFNWMVAIGDETYPVEEFETFSYNFKGLVKIKDKYYVISEDNLIKLREDISKIPENRGKADLMRYLLSSDSNSVDMDEKLQELIDNIFDIKKVSSPDSLNGELRKYQETGFSWMIQNMQAGFGSILADDMGLGKTIQLLTAVLYLKENHKIDDEKVLIIVPTSILTNWAKEIEKFTPSLKVEVYHGINRIFPRNDYDILLTSYGIVRQDLEDFERRPWYLVVIDEAQNIKNPSTQQSMAVKSIEAPHHIALSGTPIENHLGEYWSIFDFINRGYLNSLKEFKRRFINPIEKGRDREVLEDFKKITSPFILRRLKTDKSIIKDLPDKMVNDIYCNLTVKQAKMYEDTLNALIGDVEVSEGIKRKGLVLKLINSLKQICNHPSQFTKTDDALISDSGKMEVLMNTLENILISDEKVLIFTQYVEMGKIMKELIEEKFDEEVLFLYGGLHRKKRDEMIDKFQNGKPRIFILSLRAGGIGINLTAASNVIHYDLWWNPAVENQATDRAYRIGQKDNVMVYRFITTGTLEESINQILVDKRELVDLTVGSNESFITEMSDDELRNMLDLRSGGDNN